jgi:hypothetical protein
MTLGLRRSFDCVIRESLASVVSEEQGLC